jgi:putative ubiquitin-RnfH superfamily antitoxin RatB of RatAB toxin-antitoxin module
MAGREKQYIRLVDIETGEEVAAAVMTAAAVRRISKLYAAYGIYTKAVA